MLAGKLTGPDGAARVGVVAGARAALLPTSRTLADLLFDPDPPGALAKLADAATEFVPLAGAAWLAPIDRQEVWAAGVTYRRSREARMEESEQAASFYDRVYDAERPELFFKATPHRVVGPGMPVRVRRDSRWSVPEPELALVLTPDLRLAGYTIGNDMSARDIEGENPLYLPQAKVYEGCCALGPVVVVAAELPPAETLTIRMEIRRGGAVAFAGETSVAAMRRTPLELVDWLGRESRFPDGAFLLTGTGVVPPDEFALAGGDEVAISIAGVGTLVNRVA